MEHLCETCNGTGLSKDYKTKCSNCNGQGIVAIKIKETLLTSYQDFDEEILYNPESSFLEIFSNKEFHWTKSFIHGSKLRWHARLKIRRDFLPDCFKENVKISKVRKYWEEEQYDEDDILNGEYKWEIEYVISITKHFFEGDYFICEGYV